MLKRKKEKFNLRKQKGWLAGSSATQTICVSFLLVIAAGTLLLSLPIASKQGRLGLVDALFTATSATCVTGLVVRDTWTQFTFFGQAVLLLLIQVGGLGLVTLTSFFALAARRRMGFRDLRLLGESVSAEGLSKATEVLKIVIRLAATFEAMGAVLLMFALVPQFGPEGIWVSIFTAISAFCNAGFDLFGRFGAYSSVVPYGNNYYVQAVIMFMIMAGGLGFMVWVELDEALSPAEKLKVVQARMAEDDSAAADIYSSIGTYLGHTLAYYYDLYACKHVLLLGRVMSGKGGDIVLAEAKRVLREEYPELDGKILPTLPDEKFRRVGQSAAAASLPELKK